MDAKSKAKKVKITKAPEVAIAEVPIADSAPKKFRKIAICGTAESLPAAPYDDKDWEIWSLSCALTYPAFKRWDRIYELHDKDYWGTSDVLERLNKKAGDCEIWMQDVVPEVPKSRKYPLADIVQGYHANFTNSIVYMIAHAVYEKVNHIALFGVHMAAEEEYGQQRPACEYWLGIAEANGISIHIQGPSAILQCRFMYGYDKEWKMKRDLTIRKEALNQGLHQLESQLEQVKQTFWQQQGAIKDCEFMEKSIS